MADQRCRAKRLHGHEPHRRIEVERSERARVTKVLVLDQDLAIVR
jgi:hypothetical protein